MMYDSRIIYIFNLVFFFSKKNIITKIMHIYVNKIKFKYTLSDVSTTFTITFSLFPKSKSSFIRLLPP